MMALFSKQFHEMKRKHPDAVLLFRCSDFYECYEEDAEIVSEICGLTLTKKRGDKYCGFPYMALDTYLPKIIRAGKRVAICDPVEDAEGVKRHTMSRSDLERLYKQFEDFIADCKPGEVYEYEDEIKAVQTLLHSRIRMAK
jgi:DNA mismatch repair protein MutS